MSIVETPPAPAEKKEMLRGFFDSIANRYDRINRFLSWNLDESWRRKSRDLILSGHERSILDLGIGTGKFLNLFLEKKQWDRAAGLDFASGMLVRARENLPQQVHLVSADFHHMPFEDHSFDLIISAFALRSVQEFPAFFGEIQRVLTSNGKAALLCLTRPRNFLIRWLAYPYLKLVLPWVGGLLSGNRKAYQFLSSSILTFQSPDQTRRMLMSQGFKHVSIHSLSFGLATLIVAHKQV